MERGPRQRALSNKFPCRCLVRDLPVGWILMEACVTPVSVGVHRDDLLNRELCGLSSKLVKAVCVAGVEHSGDGNRNRESS